MLIKSTVSIQAPGVVESIPISLENHEKRWDKINCMQTYLWRLHKNPWISYLISWRALSLQLLYYSIIILQRTRNQSSLLLLNAKMRIHSRKDIRIKMSRILPLLFERTLLIEALLILANMMIWGLSLGRTLAFEEGVMKWEVAIQAVSTSCSWIWGVNMGKRA